jgi:hypothetical protein
MFLGGSEEVRGTALLSASGAKAGHAVEVVGAYPLDDFVGGYAMQTQDSFLGGAAGGEVVEECCFAPWCPPYAHCVYPVLEAS